MTKSSSLLATTEEPDVLKIIGERLDASGILFTLCHPVTEVFNLIPLGSAIKVDLIATGFPQPFSLDQR